MMKTKTFATAAMLILALGSLSSVWGQNWNDRDARDRGYNRGRWGYRTSVLVPAGSSIDVRLDSQISTEDARTGDAWSGTIYHTVMAGDRVAIPAGSQVSGVVTSSVQGTHETRPELALALRQVTVDGRSLRVNGETEPIVAGSNRAKKIGAIAGGAAVGALLGPTVARDHHGTLIGGLLGGAAGYGATRHALRTMQLKPGTVLTFTAREDVVARRY
jgi:hypothetical protein